MKTRYITEQVNRIIPNAASFVVIAVTTKSLRPPTKIIRILGIASYCIIQNLRLHHTCCISSVTSLNDLFSTQVEVDICSGFALNFSNFKNCENGSKKVPK